MRKSIILASFLFSVSAFSDCNHLILIYSQGDSAAADSADGVCASYVAPYQVWDMGGGLCMAESATSFRDTENTCFITQNNWESSLTTCPAGTTHSGNLCIPDDPTCPSGQSFSPSLGGCTTTPPPPLGAPIDPMHSHDNDPAGCDAAGGYYFADGSCNGGSQALAKMFQDPLATVGAMLTIGGVTFSGAGILASAAMGATPVGAVTVGVLATLAGVGSLVKAGGSLLDWTTAPSNDVTSGTTRIKVNLTTSGGSTGTIAGSNITQTDTVAGKVTSNTFVPSTVQSAMQTPANVNKTTATLVSPISLSGVRVTTYDYLAKKATTVTHSPTSTSEIPVVTQVTSVFAVSQNYDGTTTATATTQTNAPTVSGSGGGFVVSSGGGTAGTVPDAGTGTGDSTGTGPDYTGVLNDIKSNTGASSGYLSDLKNLFDAGGNANNVLTDGSADFGTLDGNVKGSYSGFIYTDPLGLNTLAGSAIPSYGFTLYGRHFVLMDQSMINQLPLDLMRNLFLFLAALAGLISVLSGV